MLSKYKVAFFERVYMRKAWAGFRDVIAGSVVPGSGGVALVGDSLTHLGRWELLLPQVRVTNFGISGERAEHILERLEPIIAVQPRQLFLLIGTNNLPCDHALEDIARSVDEILGRLSAALPDCRLHLQGLMPRERKYAPQIRALNQRYEAIARKRGLPYIDLFPRFADAQGQLRRELTGDGLHVNGAGYRVWREALSPWIEQRHSVTGMDREPA